MPLRRIVSHADAGRPSSCRRFPSGSASCAAALLTLAAARAGKSVRVSVADRGPGISPADQTGLFQRFIRVGSLGATTLGGIGFGLAITKEIIGLHGGQVGIESRSGEGTTVWFTLPVSAERISGDGHEDIDR